VLQSLIVLALLPQSAAASSQTGADTARLESILPFTQFTLDNGMHFLKFDGVPDTPDKFGAASATAFGGAAPVMFSGDGSLVDANGDVVNGSIFVGLPQQADSARAVTVFGATGMTRAWKWRGSKWME
jgi:hypothetical protein